MAVISRGTKKAYVKEMNEGGIATQLELNEHEATYLHLEDPNDPTVYGKAIKYTESGLVVDSNGVGWKDNISSLTTGGTGTPDESPLYADSGNGIWGFCFADDYINIAYADFHINHDYKPNSAIFPHIHWMPLSHSTGNVRWVIEYVVAKGHSQNETLTTTTQQIVILGTSSGLVGEHIVRNVLSYKRLLLVKQIP